MYVLELIFNPLCFLKKKMVLGLLGGLSEVTHIKDLAHSMCAINVGQHCFLMCLIMKLT